ncbi:MAG: glycine cleavage system aminomethyltransferase GcvT [Deltaproteobacteria bacterium]
MKRTALYEIHKKLGARIVEFAGWEMPVQYEGVREEHFAVRAAAGLFDVSHMGEIEVSGKDASVFCQWISTNDVLSVDIFQAQYTILCNHGGGVVDDVILYKLSDEKFLFCVNASNTAKDLEWIVNAKGDYNVEVADRSGEFSQIALQGPHSERILSETLGEDFSKLKKFRFIEIEWKGAGLLVARTGYTGEDGFEIFLPWERGAELWNSIMDTGKPYGIKPCGLGARDTLRIEMGYSLYGHEIDEDISPLEAGLGRYVKMDNGDFLGKVALAKALQDGLKNQIVGFEMIGRGVPRQGYGIFKNGDSLGNVTSGTFSPSLEKPIGLGYLKSEVGINDNIQVEIRNKMREAETVNIPFYRKNIN